MGGQWETSYTPAGNQSTAAFQVFNNKIIEIKQLTPQETWMPGVALRSTPTGYV
jgi:hypothetical protein